MNNKSISKQVGVWLDHSKAHFISFSKGPAEVETAYSALESHVRIEGEGGAGTSLGNNHSTISEHHLHNRERELMNEYYNMLTDILKGYDDILLFGSTKAKEELYNRLTHNKQFAGKTITIKSSDHLTENQMVAEVKAFYKDGKK